MLLVKLQIPQPKTHETLMNRATNSEREVVFTAYSMQPTQGCSWRHVYHNGLDWNLQIDAVLTFSSQCRSLRNIKPASRVIFTAHRTQLNTSRSGVSFAQPKCYYALKLTFGLRLNLIQLFSTLFCVYTGAQYSDLYGFPFL